MKATKPEIAGIVFAKLKPKKQDVFADVGCGSGSVSEFFAPYVTKVYAVDSDANAIKASKERLAKLKNVEVIRMDGVEFLRNYEYDVVFIGGTRNVGEMLKIVASKAERVVVNAARIEVAVNVANVMRDLGIFEEIVIANIFKSYELAGGLAFRTLNPIFIIVGSVR